MRKGGRISFNWADDEEPELNLPSKLKPSTKQTFASSSFDVSQIKDRVLQMEMGEEVILDSSMLEQLEAEGEAEEDEESLAQALRIKQAKEARANSRLKQVHAVPTEEEDYISLNGDHRLKRDFAAAEEAFTSTQHSRLVREDLVNDRDDTEVIEGFTPLNTLSKRLLERDLKSADFYYTELRLQEADDSDEEVSAWQASQARKGIEKGWRGGGAAGEFDADAFLAKQSRLTMQFTPPKPLDAVVPIDTLLLQETAQLEALKAELQAIEENCSKMRLDCEKYDFSRFDTSQEREKLGKLKEFSVLVSKWTVFLAEREAELDALTEQASMEANELVSDAWEHFFDDVDDEFLNLPALCTQFTGHDEALAHIIGFFCKYHLLKEKLQPGCSRQEILDSSGLQVILDSLSLELRSIILNKL